MLSASRPSCIDHLDSESKQRYALKLSIAGVTDPYSLPASLFASLDKHVDANNLPACQYYDIYNYLVGKSSYYTGEAMKAYKSLEGYKYFVAGWVHALQTWHIPGKQRVLVMAKVCVYNLCTYIHNAVKVQNAIVVCVWLYQCTYNVY